MIGSTIWREFSRQISEYRKFKFNLFFANLGFFFTVSGFLTYFDTNQSTFRNFILLFTWYFSSHSITHPTYFIEDEILDRTIINVIQSKQSIFRMVFIKIMVQILLDLVKALPLFFLVALVQKVKFPENEYKTVAIFSLSCFIILSLYGLGFLFASLSLIITKISSITNLLAYGILFFLGFQNQSNQLIAILSYCLPFHNLVEFIRQPSLSSVIFLLFYGLFYWSLGLLCFQFCLTYAKKKGSLSHV